MENEFCNVEAEQSLLGLILVNNNHYWKAAHISPSDFYEPVHQRIFSACQKVLESGSSVTPLQLKEQFDNDPALIKTGGAKYLLQLAKTCLGLEDAKELAGLILKNSQLRKIQMVCQSTMTKLMTEDGGYREPSEIVAQACMEMEDAVSESMTKDAESDNEILMQMVDKSKTPVLFYSTGLPALDNAMGGGLMAGKSYGIAAPKKSGKTAALATIAENLNVNKVKTLYVALEMGREQIMERIAARRLERNPIVFLTHERTQEHFVQKLLQIRSEGNLYFLDYAGVTFAALKSILLRAVRRLKPSVVIVDYWQLIGGKGKGQNQTEHQDAVAQWLAEFGKAYNVAMVVASQINQEGNTRGGEGMRLAFDQVYKMNRVELTTTHGVEIQTWWEMMDTRYTQWTNLGDEHNPAFRINPKGVFMEQLI